MLELLHERNLADGGAGRALLRIEMDFLQSNELARLSVATFEDLRRTESSEKDSACGPERGHGELTVAYVPSPSFSSCWKADGLFLLILAASMLRLLKVDLLGDR